MVTDMKKNIIDPGVVAYVDHNNVLVYAYKGGTRFRSLCPRTRSYAHLGRLPAKNVHEGYILDLSGNARKVSYNCDDGYYGLGPVLVENVQSLSGSRLSNNNSSALFYKIEGESDHIHSLFPDNRSYDFAWSGDRSNDFSVVIDSTISNIAISYSRPASPDQVYIDFYEFSNTAPVFIRTVNTMKFYNFSLGLRAKVLDTF